jgi:nitroreductase
MTRSYDAGRPVSDDALDAVVAAALRAPSAGFTQAVSLLVLTGPADRGAFWAATARGTSRWLDGMRTAPALVLFWTDREAYLDRYAEPDKGWSDRDPSRWSAPYWFVDAGMAAMAALLAAEDAGLGACFFGVPVDRVEAVRARFGVPEGQLSVGALTLGHRASAAPTGSSTRRPRKPAEVLVHRGRWSLPGAPGQ